MTRKKPTQADAEQAALVGGLEESPWHQLRILADWHEDHGDVHMALAWRWLADHTRFPRRLPSGYWLWRRWGQSEPRLVLAPGLVLVPAPSGMPPPQDATLERLPCLKAIRRRKSLSAAFFCAALEMATWFELRDRLESEGQSVR
jgi:hypothetical protein